MQFYVRGKIVSLVMQVTIIGNSFVQGKKQLQIVDLHKSVFIKNCFEYCKSLYFTFLRQIPPHKMA